MPQFSVYQNPNPASRKAYPYLLDVQSDLLAGLRTTVVVPLAPMKKGETQAIANLTPVVTVNGERYIALIQLIAGVGREGLGRELGDLSSHRAEIVAAIDFMLAGI